MKAQYVYQSFTLTIAAAGATVKAEFDSSRRGKRITGVALGVSRLLLSGEFGLKVDTVEYFPDEFPAPLLIALPYNDMGSRFFELEAPADGSKVEISFTDQSPTTGFTAYTVTLTLRMTQA